MLFCRFLPLPAAGTARVADTAIGTAATAATATASSGAPAPAATATPATDTATTTDAEMDRNQWVPDPSRTQQVWLCRSILHIVCRARSSSTRAGHGGYRETAALLLRG